MVHFSDFYVVVDKTTFITLRKSTTKLNI